MQNTLTKISKLDDEKQLDSILKAKKNHSTKNPGTYIL